LAIAWLTAFTCALTTFVYPPLLEEMIGVLEMSLPQAGLLMSLTTLTTMTFTFFGGIASDKFGSRMTMGMGIVIMAVAQILSGLANTFVLEAFTRLLLGVGIGLAIVCVIKSMAEWFPSKELALAQSIQATGWAVGNAAGLALAIPVSFALGMAWRGAFLAFGGFAAGVVVLYWILAKERRQPVAEVHRENKAAASVLEMLKIRELWLITFGMAGAFSGSSIIMTWLPKSLIDMGWSEASASLLATVVPTIGIPANLAGGIVSDRLGRRKPLIAVSAVCLSVSYWLFTVTTQGLLAWVAAALSGWFGYFYVGPLLAIPSELPEVGHERSGTFFGTMQVIAGVAGFTAPLIVGWIREVTGSFTLGFALAAITPCSLLIPGIFGRETGRPSRPL